ncbi:MAG TPA: carboxypeptidase regulatory-like domain-containing protein [Thermoanaerobaculia bacterium]|nr:carboxypeptidase regulatory-like domain-containing protein [Thermoanaerobaculia bacterium]
MSMSKAAPSRVPAWGRSLGILFLLAGEAFAESAAEPFLVGGSVLPIAGTSAPPSALVVELRPAFPSFDAQRAALHGDEPDALLTARVRADGTFLLIVPKPDSYRIDARAQGFRRLTIPFLPLVEPIQLAPIKPVTVLPLAIQVLDPNGQPAREVTVRVASPAAQETPADPSAWRPAVERARTDSQGRAVVYRDSGAKIQVLAESPGGTALVEVPADAPWTVMKLTARPSLSLAVRDSAGRPASGALVYAAGSAIAEIDEEGLAEVPAVSPEGAHLLVVSESGEWVEVKAPKEGAKGPVAVRLGPPRKARGKVLDSTSEKPIPQSIVWARGNGAPGRGGIADSQGSFEILFAGSGRPAFGAAATGHASREISATVTGPRDAPVTPRLDRAPPLQDAVAVFGVVADTAGSPIAGAELFTVRTVEILTHGRRTKERIAQPLDTSDLQGGFAAEGLLPGAFDLLACANGYVCGRVGSLQIPAGQRLFDLKFLLSRGVRIEGTLRDSSGHPSPGVTIEAAKVLSVGSPIAEVELPRSTTVSDRDGLFTLTGLEPGRYEVTAESPLGTASGLVEVGKEGGRVELRLEPDATP